MMKYASLVLFSLLLVVGQILFKKGAESLPGETGWQLATAMVSNVWLWCGIFIYGLSTVLWVLILRSTPLSAAYPFIALGFVFVPMVSWWMFGETIRLPYYFGVILILAGIYLITLATDIS